MSQFNLDQLSEEQRILAPLVLQFLNIVVKQVLRARKFLQIGKLPKFFLENERKEIPQHNLLMWPGYMATTRLLADGIFLNIDTCAKFINKTSILDMINKMTALGKTK